MNTECQYTISVRVYEQDLDAQARQELGEILNPHATRVNLREWGRVTWNDLMRWGKSLRAQCLDADRELQRVKAELATERARRCAAEVQLKRLKGDKA